MKSLEERKRDKERLELADSLAAEYFDILMDDITIKYHTGWYNNKYSYARSPHEIADDMMMFECMDMADDYRYRMHNETVSQDTKEILEQHKLDIQSNSEDFALIYNKLLDARIQVCFNVTALLSDKAMPFEKKVERMPSEIIQEAQSPIFSTPEGTTWEEVTFRIGDDNRLTIQVGGETSTYTHKTAGFFNQRNGEPDVAWNLLVVLAQNDNHLTRRTTATQVEVNAFKQRVSKLRRLLKRLMGMEDDPFHKYQSIKAYKLKANLLDKRTIDKPNDDLEDSLYWSEVSSSGVIDY